MKRSWRAEEVRRGVLGSEAGQDLEGEKKEDGIPAAHGKSWRWELVNERHG